MDVVVQNSSITLGRIEKKSADEVISRISNLSESITLEIQSDGGSWTSALRIFDMLQNSKYPVTGFVKGMAGSSAILVLNGCDKRVIEEQTTIQFHTVVIKREYHLIDTAVLEYAAKLESEVANYIAQRSRNSKDMIIRWMRQQRNLTAEEALKWNLIDKIKGG